MAKVTWPDSCRCHDVHVLHWLVNSQKFKLLITDFCVPEKGSLIVDTSLPPKERMDFEGAKQWFKDIGSAKKTLLDLFTDCQCNNVVMLFPERSENHLTYCALLLRNLAQLHTAQKFNHLGSDWTLGILFNIHRFPLDIHGQEQVQVGFNLAHGTEVLHQSLWGFIDQVVVLTPPKVAQFGAGCWSPTPVSRSSYFAVARFTGENLQAKLIMEAAAQARGT